MSMFWTYQERIEATEITNISRNIVVRLLYAFSAFTTLPVRLWRCFC